jgi:6-phosphogluconolactonase
MSYADLTVLEDADALARQAASLIEGAALAQPGVVRVALSGGSTPKRTYQILATDPWRGRVPWDCVHWYFGDERFVPPDHPESNFRMAREALFDHVPVPPENLHPVPTEGVGPEEAADRYAAMLRADYGADQLQQGRPLFHLCLLGLGEDGHTASLIPGQPVLEERTRWVAEVGKGRPEVRITITYPVIDNAGVTAFLVSGAGKRAVLADLLTGTSTVPAARLHPQGRLMVLADKAAHPA